MDKKTEAKIEAKLLQVSTIVQEARNYKLDFGTWSRIDNIRIDDEVLSSVFFYLRLKGFLSNCEVILVDNDAFFNESKVTWAGVNSIAYSISFCTNLKELTIRHVQTDITGQQQNTAQASKVLSDLINRLSQCSNNLIRLDLNDNGMDLTELISGPILRYKQHFSSLVNLDLDDTALKIMGKGLLIIKELAKVKEQEQKTSKLQQKGIESQDNVTTTGFAIEFVYDNPFLYENSPKVLLELYRLGGVEAIDLALAGEGS